MSAFTEARAWEILARVADPEIPVVSVTDLGIVREVHADENGVEIIVTPTYAGCPATDVIRRDIEQALRAAGASAVSVQTRLAPPWTTDDIAPDARERLRAYGIAPPQPVTAGEERPITFVRRPTAVACPRCGADDTERLSQFGATPCKALYRCRACREPFELFKPL
jgi:ring-1,2-phenylacetyl-CoA epoxidase subunit PaaD